MPHDSTQSKDVLSLGWRAKWSLVKKHGLAKAVQPFMGQLDRKYANFFFCRLSYKAHVLLNRPYFGEYMVARQGPARRHKVLRNLAQNFIKKNPELREISILEVGSYMGGSAIQWAKALKDFNQGRGHVTCVDPWDIVPNHSTHQSVSSELNDMNLHLDSGNAFQQFKRNIKAAGISQYIRIHQKSFSDFYQELNNQKFDIIYIDGDHRYAAVKNDLQLAKNLLAPGGLLCGDDFELSWALADQAHGETALNDDMIFDPRNQRFYHPGISKALFETFADQVNSEQGVWWIQ